MANLRSAADAIRARTAGVKQTPTATKNVAQAESKVSAFLGDIASTLHLTGGPHPESVPAAISTALSRATDAVRGAHGGTVPRTTSVGAPGPAGGTNAAASGHHAGQHNRRRRKITTFVPPISRRSLGAKTPPASTTTPGTTV